MNNSKLFSFLEQFKANLENIELKEKLSQELDNFFKDKNNTQDIFIKLDNVLSDIPENELVVDRLRLNIELKNSDGIRYYKELFVSKYGGKLEDDENYINLGYLVYFLGLIPNPIALELADNIIDNLKSKSIKEAYIPFLEGVKLHTQNKYEEAIDKFNNARFIDTGFWYAYQFIAYTYFDLKEYRIAIGYFKKFFEFINKLKPEFVVDSYLYTSYCYFRIKDFKNTTKFLKKCLKINPNYYYANNLMGYSLYKLKEYDKAIPYLDKSIKNGKDGLYPYWNKIQVYKATGDFDKAMEIIEELKTKSKSKKSIKNEIESIKKLKKKRKNKKSVTPPIVDSILEFEIEDDENVTDFVPEAFEKDISGIQLETEKILEDLLEKRLLKGKPTFGKKLKIYDNGYYGRQFRTDTGRMDILTQDKEDNSYVIIELKRGKSDIEVVEQIQNYIDWTKKNLAKPGQAVKGIICIKEATNRLKALVKTIPGIELYEYEFDFIKIA